MDKGVIEDLETILDSSINDNENMFVSVMKFSSYHRIFCIDHTSILYFRHDNRLLNLCVTYDNVTE